MTLAYDEAGPRLVDACGIAPGDRVLDVAAGTGSASVPAAERGAQVMACDRSPELLEAGRRSIGALDIAWLTADAEELPFASGTFDVVMSCIGVMFAPAADELVRVCRAGGTIGLLSWTPRLWRSEDRLQELFGDRVRFHTLERDRARLEREYLLAVGTRA